MRRERIRSTPSWRNGPPRHDCVFVETDTTKPGMRGMHVARIKLFFSFKFDEAVYPCALVEWFEAAEDTPDEDTGMWIVEPEVDNDGHRVTDVIHVDSILHAAHLIPCFGDHEVDVNFHFSSSLDTFSSFYVNKFADHHAFEIAR